MGEDPQEGEGCAGLGYAGWRSKEAGGCRSRACKQVLGEFEERLLQKIRGSLAGVGGLDQDS